MARKDRSRSSSRSASPHERPSSKIRGRSHRRVRDNADDEERRRSGRRRSSSADDRRRQDHSRRRQEVDQPDGAGRHRPQVRVKEEPRSDSETDRSDRRRRGAMRSPPAFRKDDRSRDRKEVKWGKAEDQPKDDGGEAKPKEKPNFGLTGSLAADTNTFHGVVIKYSEPPEARKPKLRWSLYPFKGDQNLPVLYIHRQSAYLIGRDRRVADIPIDHPSCSKQHAALQYRVIPETTANGRVIRRIKPYLIDLGSANGTFINNKKIEAQRYYELLEKDVMKFGFSTREYVILNERSVDHDDKSSEEDSDVDRAVEEAEETTATSEEPAAPAVAVLK